MTLTGLSWCCFPPKHLSISRITLYLNALTHQQLPAQELVEGGLHASLLAQRPRLITPLGIQAHFSSRISILVLGRLPLPAAQTQAQMLDLTIEAAVEISAPASASSP